MTENISKCTIENNIKKFVILKTFSVNIDVRKAFKIVIIVWKSSTIDYVKCNKDKAIYGNLFVLFLRLFLEVVEENI